MTCKESGFVLDQGTHLIDIDTLFGRNIYATISGRLVYGFHLVVILPQLVVVQIDLIEQQHRRYMIGFGSYQYTVYEACGSPRQSQCYHQAVLVDIGCNHMRLLRQLGRTANYTVFSFFYLGYHSRIVRLLYGELHPVAHSYGIGAFVSFHSKTTSQTTIVSIAIATKHLIPTSCCFYYKTFHFLCHYIGKCNYRYFTLSGFSVRKLAHDLPLAFLGLPTVDTSGISFCRK